MENTFLNKAHEAGRRAVKLVRKGQLSEAADWHQKAAAILHELDETLGEDSLCKRSLEEQVKFHRRQAQLARVLRSFFEKKVKLQKMDEKTDNEKKKVLQPITNNIPLRRPEIQRQFDEAESLLQILSNRKLDEYKEPHDGQGDVRPLEFTIRPKHDSDVIEELQMVNLNLRTLVDKLLTELNEAREENKELRKKLEGYENKEINVNPFQTQLQPENQANNEQSSSAYELLSAAEGIRLSIVSRSESTILPELEPLEDPEFDVSEFSTHY